MFNTVQNGYIRSLGDQSYCLGYSDFTVEFYVSLENITPTQTLFELTNDSNNLSYSKTRFILAVENGNLTGFATKTTAINVAANTNTFLSPIVPTANIRVFYDGHWLLPNQYVISGGNVIVNNSLVSTSNTIAEIGQDFFSVTGGTVTANTNHFISAERFENNFYLYLDGQAISVPQSAYVSLPEQYPVFSANNQPNFSFGNVAGLVTIGANKDGQDPVSGVFGDIRIIKNHAIHTQPVVWNNEITSSFTDTMLGTRTSDVILDSGNFVDNINSYAPEEAIQAQIYDTLYISIYQSNIANPTSNILGYGLVKPQIMAGPIGSFTTNIIAGTSTYKTPWYSLNAGDASVLVNGNVLPANQWSLNNTFLTANINGATTGNIEVICTGPVNYFSIAANSVSTLTSNFYFSDTSIHVSNVANFITPVLGGYANISNNIVNQRGIVWVNEECISYLYLDTGNNIVSGLTRGVNGTGVPIVHIANTQIISASYNRDLYTITGVDPSKQVWYSNIAAGTSLQNTNSIFSNVLLNFGTVPPATPF